MKCIYCGTPLGKTEYCTGCGADVTLLWRISRISNLLYNRGLEKASVRDLSGAIGCLQQSLKFNKENVSARNLLGLCYYETGEVVSALCEWVISNNMYPGEDNLARHYITSLQENRNQLDVINQSIRKYNQSIEYCRQDDEDMAIMQLRKVVSQNPKLVKAQQLLALLYMKHQEYEKARRVLRKAAAIDNTNTTTLRFLTEIEEVTGKGVRRKRYARDDGKEREEKQGGTFRYISGSETIIQPTTFRDSSTVATFINIGLGVLLGGAIIWFMTVPAMRQSIQDSANQQVADANMQLASQTAELQDLQGEIEGYQNQVSKAEEERDVALKKTESYDQLLSVASLYVNGEHTAAVEAVTKISESDLEGNAKTLYERLTGAVSSAMFDQYYSAGTAAYVSADYKTSAEQLKKAVEADPEGTNANYYNALLYLAHSYYQQNDTANANKYFNEIIEKFPAQASAVQGYITSSPSGQAGVQNAAAGQTGTDAQAQNGIQTGGAQGQANGTDPAQNLTGNTTGNTGTGQDITIVDNNSGANTGYDDWYDPTFVAWTDPNTGLGYDVYGNLIG